jgi:hypothetical protein
MSITTFTELKTAVQSWINKSSISAQADDFVTLAENHLNLELRVQRMMVLKTGTVSDNPLDLATELTRFARVRSMSINVGGAEVPLSYISQDLRMGRLNDISSGIPEYYTLIGDNLYLDPAPNDTYAYTLLYYQKLEPLSGTVASNWLLADQPNIYLYAALTEAAIFAKDQNAAQGYIALRDRYIGALKSADLRDRAGGSSRMISETVAV